MHLISIIFEFQVSNKILPIRVTTRTVYGNITGFNDQTETSCKYRFRQGRIGGLPKKVGGAVENLIN